MAKIWLELKKKWGEYQVGDVVSFDERKGRSLIANGSAVQTSAPQPAKPKKRPQVETATAEPQAETAEVTPRRPRRSKKGGE